LASFTGTGYDRGRSFIHQIAWYVVMNVFFVRWWFPARFRPALLRAFGASVGSGVLVRSRVRVHWPWKLTIGNDCWIGEGAWLLNLEPIVLGHDVCVSQEALLCTGSHDHRDPAFEFDNAPISVADGGWVATRAVVLRGVRVGRESIVAAGVTAHRDVPDGHVLLPSGLRALDG